jgi:putative copper export protein
MICILANYYLLRKHGASNLLKKNRSLTSQSLLFGVGFVAGAICIFGNSMTSHNSAVNFIPSVAVFIDWMHLMAVSLWIGGLFYISVVLLHSLKTSERLQQPPQLFSLNEKNMQLELQVSRDKTQDSAFKITPTTYYLALLLPRFSLIATISLGVIGISGIYMAWIQLHTFNELFNSAYGNVLIIKLAIALPVVLLGTYHQIRIHNFTTVIANIGNTGTTTTSDRNKAKNSISGNHLVQNFKKENRVIRKLASMMARNKKNSHDNVSIINKSSVFSRFASTIKIESLLAVFLLLAASLLSITSPNSMSMASMPNMVHITSTSSSSQMAMTENQMQMKNSTLVKQSTIMNVNTKIEINPFYSGFNTFKITFTDPNGKPYTKITGAEMIFKNEKADIGPIVVTMKKIQPNIFAVGTFIGLPGEWNIAMAAQRQADYDLNYAFASKITNAPQPSNTNMNMGSTSNDNNNNNILTTQNQEQLPKLDSFAILAMILSILLGIISWYTYQRSKQDLKLTIDRIEGGQ